MHSKLVPRLNLNPFTANDISSTHDNTCNDDPCGDDPRGDELNDENDVEIPEETTDSEHKHILDGGTIRMVSSAIKYRSAEKRMLFEIWRQTNLV